MKNFLFIIFATAFFSGCADLKTAKVNAAQGNTKAAWSDWVTLADAGYPEAMVELGSLYMKGEVVPQSPELAVDLFERAASQNSAKAFFELGKAYEKGMGVSKDGTKAAQMYQRAAALGNARGWQAEGSLYAKGKVVPENAGKAERLLLAAIEQDNARAGFDYAELLIKEGKGLEAAKYYEWALQNGYPRAGLKLAEHYSVAGILPNDHIWAYACYLAALKAQARLTQAESLKIPDKILGLENSLSKQDQAAAQALALLILPEKPDRGFRIELANHGKSKKALSASDSGDE